MSDVSDAIARLQTRFLARAADDVDALRAWSADPSPPIDDLRRLVHRLAGGAGTFGFHRLSALAGDAEDAILVGAPDRCARLADVVTEIEHLTGS